MTFTFHLTGPTGASREADGPEDQGPLEDPDDYGYLAMRGCADLARTDAVFRIGGFGLEDWGFDISYDMSSFVESLPELAEALHGRTEYVLDLYPPGVERTLTFRFPDEETVEVECASRTSWIPHPAKEICSRTVLLTLCQEFRYDFAVSLEAAGSDVASRPPFRRWRVAGVGSGDFCAW